MIRRLRWVVAGAALLMCVGGGLGRVRPAAAARFALLVGNNEGQGGDPHLRFAEADTIRLAEVLSRLGGFGTGGTVVLQARTADDLRRAIADLRARLAATPGEHMVLVYYSGHADAQALHLGASSFPLGELGETISALPAATRVLVLDACQAGVLTRAKGGRPGVGFELDAAQGEATKGFAILASSAGSELAQESDQLGASVFTHFLRVGLSGLADRNHDGEVSLAEVFDYTADRTLAATLGTTTGPQHPTFRLELAGRDGLVLTRPRAPGAGYGRLQLDVPGWYFIRRGDGSIAAEVVSRGEETLAMESGSYQITRRDRDKLDVGAVSITDGGATAISRTPTRPVAFGQMVRKGGERAVAYGLAATTTVRTPLEDLGPSLGAALAARADLRALSFELRLGLGRARQDTTHFSSTTWDVSAAVAALRMHDVGADGGRGTASRLSWGYGLEAGVARMSQRLDTGEARGSWNPFVGPVALAELAVGRRFFLRATVGVPVYALRVQADDGAATVWRPALATALGGGTSF
jgi:hypothetical protein